MKIKRTFSLILTGLLVLSTLLAGCQAATTEVASSVPPTQPPTQPPAATATLAPMPTDTLVPTITPTPAPTQDPRIGGTAVLSLAAEPDTLDIQKSSSGSSDAIMALVGAQLLTRDPKTGEVVPYLAESYKVSEDGKTLTFTLKDGVKFSDGTPLTADDFAFTFNRAIDPKTASPVTAVLLKGLVAAKAIDARTLELDLDAPNFSIINGLTLSGYVVPYSKAYVTAKGDDYIARNPMSVGPYIFKEWKTGERIVLERNPDFTWGPSFAPGPRFVQTVEFRVIPDQATMISALEAGETLMDGVPESEIARFQDTTKFTIYQTMDQSLYPALAFNLNKDPWKDINMRQALSYAVDRQGIINVLLQGKGEPAYGPLPPSISGYTKDVEKYYNYDAAKALELFAKSGYTQDASKKLVKDGKQLAFKLVTPSYDFILPGLEIIKEQFKAIGIDMTIESVDPSLLSDKVNKGDFDLVVTGYNYPTSDVLYFFFHSSMVGAGTNTGIADPDLDKLLDAARTSLDAAKHDQLIHDIQIYIVEHAYWITTINQVGNLVVSTKLQDAYWSVPLNSLRLENAWIKP